MARTGRAARAGGSRVPGGRRRRPLAVARGAGPPGEAGGSSVVGALLRDALGEHASPLPAGWLSGAEAPASSRRALGPRSCGAEVGASDAPWRFAAPTGTGIVAALSRAGRTRAT